MGTPGSIRNLERPDREGRHKAGQAVSQARDLTLGDGRAPKALSGGECMTHFLHLFKSHPYLEALGHLPDCPT